MGVIIPYPTKDEYLEAIEKHKKQLVEAELMVDDIRRAIVKCEDALKHGLYRENLD